MSRFNRVIVFVIVFFVAFGVQGAFAYNLLGGKQQSTSLTVRKESSLTSSYQVPTSSAVWSWNDADTPLGFSITNTGGGDIYVGGDNLGDDDTLASTYSYKEYIWWGDYTSSHITINYDETDKYLSSGTKVQGIIAHEIGHALGLAHDNDNPDVIMCQTKYGRTVDTPQQDDIDGINSLY